MRAGLVPLALWAMACSAQAQEELPAFGDCFSDAIGAFEIALEGAAAQGQPDYDLINGDAVFHCGSLAIARCDRQLAPLDCQAALTTEISGLRATIRAGLPAPDDVAGRDGIWSDDLFPRFLLVADGGSAGPDCAGSDAQYEGWCFAHQARLRLVETVMVWQLARLLGGGESAVEAGWVSALPPSMPEQRP